MGYKCCVPRCRGNYDTNNKVHLFKFPEDEEIKNKWIHAIRRKNFIPTKHSMVCQFHFKPEEIQHNTIFHLDNGQEIILPKKIPRLVPGSIPSRFSCFSNTSVFTKKKLLDEMIPAKVKAKKNRRKAGDITNQVSKRNTAKNGTPRVQKKTKTSRDELQYKIKIDGEKQNKDTSVKGKKNMKDGIETKEKIPPVPLCRLCASPSEDAVSVFEDLQSNCVLLEKIHTYLPIMMTAEDELPTTVCLECVSKLEVCHSLIQGCMDADAMLKTMYSLQKSNQVQPGDEAALYDCNSTNFTDTKFEVESDIDVAEEQTLKEGPDKNIARTQNSVMATDDTQMTEEPSILEKLINKQTVLRINRRRKPKYKFVIVKKNASNNPTNVAQLRKVVKLAMKANMMSVCSKRPRPILEALPSLDSCSVETHKEIFLKDREQPSRGIQERIARDHTYISRVSNFENN